MCVLSIAAVCLWCKMGSRSRIKVNWPITRMRSKSSHRKTNDSFRQFKRFGNEARKLSICFCHFSSVFFSIRLQLIKRRKEDNKSFLTRNNKITNIIAQYSTIFTTNRYHYRIPNTVWDILIIQYSIQWKCKQNCEQKILNKKTAPHWIKINSLNIFHIEKKNTVS